MPEVSRVKITGFQHIVYDEMLTRDVVLGRKWRFVSICKKFVSLEVVTGKNETEVHQYLPVEMSRVKSLKALLTENKIAYYCSVEGNAHIVKPPQEKKQRQFVPKTRAEYAEKRREGLMAAAARVLDYKAREAERATWANPEEDAANDALASSEEREVDCW